MRTGRKPRKGSPQDQTAAGRLHRRLSLVLTMMSLTSNWKLPAPQLRLLESGRTPGEILAESAP